MRVTFLLLIITLFSSATSPASEGEFPHGVGFRLYLEELSDYSAELPGVDKTEFKVLARRFAYKSFLYFYFVRNVKGETDADKFWRYAFRVMDGKSREYDEEELWSKVLSDPVNIKRLKPKRNDYSDESLDSGGLPVSKWLDESGAYQNHVKTYRAWLAEKQSE